MQLYVYSNFSKKVNSTKIPLSGGTLKTVVLKKETSLDNPVFLLSGVDLSVNYCHLVNGRYYFVNDIVVGNNNMYELHCTTDVLGTFRNEIIGSSFYIERSASNYNNMFIDPLVSIQQNVVARDITLNDTGFGSNDYSWIVRIAGGDTDGVSTYVVDSLSDLAPIFDKTKYFTTNDDSFKQLVGNFIFDPYDYVIGLYLCPISLTSIKNMPSSGYDTTIKVKWFNTGISAYKLYNNYTTRMACGCTAPTNIYSDFRKYDPRFSKYYAYIPGVGTVPIDGNNAQNLLVEYYIALDTGNTRVTLINLTDNTFFASYNTNIYTYSQYGQAQANVGTLLTSAMTSIGGFASGNLPMGITGAIQTVQNIVVPTPSIAGSNGGLGIQGANKVILQVDNYGSGSLDIVNFGRPLNNKVSLATLSGFTKCGGASIDITGFASDKDKVNAYLNGGFFIE